jgi:hypothetical protein
VRDFALLAIVICAAIGVTEGDFHGAAGSDTTDTAVLGLPRAYNTFAISRETHSGIVLFARSRENPRKCVNIAIQALLPPRLRQTGVVATSCNEPRGSTMAVPLYNSLNGDWDASTVHVLTLNLKTNEVTIGPTLMTYTELSDNQVETSSASGSLWIYLCQSTNGPQLLRVSQANGKVLNTISMPAICRTAVSASSAGFSMRRTFNTDWFGSPVIGVYDVAPHSNLAVLVQRCSYAGGWAC